MMILSLVAMTGLEKHCLTSAYLLWLFHSGERAVAHRPLVYITKTCLYNFDPLKPHFYIVKLGFTEVYIIFLISAQKHRLMFWAEIWKLSEFFYLKNFGFFFLMKFSLYLNRRVFVMFCETNPDVKECIHVENKKPSSRIFFFFFFFEKCLRTRHYFFIALLYHWAKSADNKIIFFLFSQKWRQFAQNVKMSKPVFWEK